MKPYTDCDLARDLMPAELDGVCSDSSRAFIQSHLRQCSPCRQVYDQLKALPRELPDISAPSEGQALMRSMKQASHRWRAVKIGLVAALGTVLALLLFAGIRSIQWNQVRQAPLSLYDMQVNRVDAHAYVELAYAFTNLSEVRQSIEETDDGGVIHTYTVDYYPARAASEKLVDPAYLYMHVNYGGMCVKDGQLYTIASARTESTSEGQILWITPGTPIREIRITDGKDTRTIYTQGDEIRNLSMRESGIAFTVNPAAILIDKPDASEVPVTDFSPFQTPAAFEPFEGGENVQSSLSVRLEE